MFSPKVLVDIPLPANMYVSSSSYAMYPPPHTSGPKVLVDIPLPAPSHNELMDDERIVAMNPIERLIKRTATDAADFIDFVATPPKVFFFVLCVRMVMMIMTPQILLSLWPLIPRCVMMDTRGY
jgi:hypothetical protein